MSAYDGGPIGHQDADYVQRVTVQEFGPLGAFVRGSRYNFLPTNDGSWRRVQIDINWLKTLTPPVNTVNPFQSSLAMLLRDIGADNSTGLVVKWEDIAPSLESIVATLVADGMSRQGYTTNGGSSTRSFDTRNLLPWNNSASSQDSILAGTHAFPRPEGAATRLRWTIVVGGYAYRADSTAYYLALTVLFLHAAFALAHVSYILWTRICSDAFDSFIGLIVLAALSGKRGIPDSPSNIFENASAGVERYRTMATEVRVRVKPASRSAAPGQEHIQLLFGDEKYAQGYRELEEIKAYG